MGAHLQDRQGELRRVGDQAANLADELAQSQHQAQLEQQHASDLQSDSISGKLHLMQEVERLTKECGKAQAEAARLHTALAEAQQGRGQADAQQGPGAVGQEGGREPLPEASAQVSLKHAVPLLSLCVCFVIRPCHGCVTGLLIVALLTACKSH